MTKFHSHSESEIQEFLLVTASWSVLPMRWAVSPFLQSLYKTKILLPYVTVLTQTAYLHALLNPSVVPLGDLCLGIAGINSNEKADGLIELSPT